MTASIALIDDDRNILGSVTIALEMEGFDVHPYWDSEAGLKGINENNIDLVVLDVKMPRMDGMELLKKMKSSPKTEHIPVIFLTSKDNEMDEVQGLRLGADDYITKPFSQRLLLERVRTILRRQERLRPKDGSKPLLLESVTQGDLTMEDASYTCLWKGEKVDLTVTEYLVLKGLVINPTHVKTRDQLIEYAYKDPINVDDRTIDSHIKRIRKKIRAVDSDFDQIFSIYGVGYSYSK